MVRKHKFLGKTFHEQCTVSSCPLHVCLSWRLELACCQMLEDILSQRLYENSSSKFICSGKYIISLWFSKQIMQSTQDNTNCYFFYLFITAYPLQLTSTIRTRLFFFNRIFQNLIYKISQHYFSPTLFS